MHGYPQRARKQIMRGLLLTVLAVMCSQAQALDRSQVEGYLLPNGLQLLLKGGDDRSHVSIRLVVGVGFDDFSCAEQELPHLLEHLMFSGIDEGGEGGLEERLQALGGEWNAFTSNADTTFVIEAPARNQRKVLDLLLQVVNTTVIDETALDTARRIVAREDGGHFSHLQRFIDRQDLGRSASSQLAVELGLKCAQRSDVENLSLEQVQAVREHWYAPNNMTLIVVGGLDRLLPAYLERAWGELEAVEPSDHQDLRSISQPAQARRELTTGWVGEGAKLHWYFVEPVLDTAQPQTLSVLQSYLDWALYRELRLEHGLSYGPWSEREAYGDTGLLSLNADLERDDVAEAERLIGGLIERLKRDGLDPATFQRLQQLAVDRQSWAAQGNSALADYYWSALADYSDGRFASPARQIRDVSLQEANETLRQLFAEPGYLRIEQPLFNEERLYRAAVGALVVLVLCIGLAVWLRQRRPRQA